MYGGEIRPTASDGQSPRVCILKADGTNCEIETRYAFDKAGGRAEIVLMNQLRRRALRLSEFDALVIPGGFSYGDDIAAGKVLAVEILSFLSDEIGDFARSGKPILGICNGFQVLVRTGLLPFGEPGKAAATLTTNSSGRFECRWVSLVPEKAATSPALGGRDAPLELPMAHAEGRFYAERAVLDRVERERLVMLRYADRDGRPTDSFPDNPNGSLAAIAGISDPTGRIIGLMPHPERFTDARQHPAWRSLLPHAGGNADEGPDPDGLAYLRRFLALA